MSYNFIYCEKCGKKLLQRKPNGIFVFKFGKSRKGNPVVNLEIHGSVRITCFRETCQHVNIINYFPEMFTPKEPKKEEIE
ncbi:MAG: hypothetical protein ACOC80_11010 [Petrotogales bacterium]